MQLKQLFFANITVDEHYKRAKNFAHQFRDKFEILHKFLNAIKIVGMHSTMRRATSTRENSSTPKYALFTKWMSGNDLWNGYVIQFSCVDI